MAVDLASGRDVNYENSKKKRFEDLLDKLYHNITLTLGPPEVETFSPKEGVGL